MNKLMTQSQATDLAISTETRDLIQQGIAPNTIKAYQTATQKLEAWLDGQNLTDGLLATYITELHHQGKSPATIAQVVAAVKWTASKSRIDVVGEWTASKSRIDVVRSHNAHWQGFGVKERTGGVGRWKG